MLDCVKYRIREVLILRKATVLMSLLAIVMLLGGCVRQIVNTQVPPLAYIDSVSPSQVYVGEKIKFSGHGVSSVGQIVSYNWRSNVNGDLSQLASFDSNTLTAGPHTVWFKVQDSYGNWSQEVGVNVDVLTQGGPSKMTIRAFGASPPNINQSDWTTLTWDVTGTGSVRIEPDIGDVAQSGSRSVQPLQTKTYKIFATNDQGIESATMVVVVTPIPVFTLIIYSIAAEDGTIRGNDVTFNEVFVGQDQYQHSMQGFLSFDISSIPPNAVIKSVQLDLSRANIINHPFPWLGSLLIYNQSYGLRLDANNNTVYLQNTPLLKWIPGYISQMPDSYFTSPDMLKTVQTLIDTRSNRFQIKLQMDKSYYYPVQNYSDNKYQWSSREANYVDIGSGVPKLIILYTMPN
jgi:hypothetical protein